MKAVIDSPSVETVSFCISSILGPSILGSPILAGSPSANDLLTNPVKLLEYLWGIETLARASLQAIVIRVPMRNWNYVLNCQNQMQSKRY